MKYFRPVATARLHAGSLLQSNYALLSWWESYNPFSVHALLMPCTIQDCFGLHVLLADIVVLKLHGRKASPFDACSLPTAQP